MNILVRPESLSLSGNIEKFRISSAEEVSFTLSMAGKKLLSSVYTPGTDGFIAIDVRDIIEAHLSVVLKDISTQYEQTSLVADFTAQLNDNSYTFRVIRSGVDRLAVPAADFLKHNFLTWQPQTKAVTYYTPEYLTYYAAESSYLKVKAYFTTDGSVINKTKQLASLASGKAYTVSVQYAVIAGLFESQLPSFYDVWVENASGTRLTYIQRYVAGDILSEQEQWVLFENSLGGIDCFRAYGQCDFTGDHTHNIAEVDEIAQEYRVDTERKFQKSTGYLDDRHRRWLLDFFPSKAKYIYLGNYLRSIVVTESNVSYTDKELPSEFQFTYKYADARPYLNLQRVDKLPDNLHISIPDLGSFSIPPRLVEFPSQPLSEGVLLPVQNPYSENWATTTIGGIFNYVLNRIYADYSGDGSIGHAHTNFDLLQMLSYVDEYLLVNGKKIKAGYADGIAGDTFIDLVKFLKGFLVGENGSGITVLEDGTTQAVVDRLYVKIKAVFDELEVKKKTHVGGEQILSPAGMKCVRVEELENAYRCYFLSEVDGVAINNEFTTGTLGLAQECNIKEGVSHNVSNRFYWREVINTGVDYIDLSKTNCDKDSDIPEAGDDIVGLGHLTDITRQGAIVLSSVNETSPSIIFYAGINSFSLAGKEVIALGFDKSTGHAYINVYGDAYIGAKDETSYIRYTQKGGVDIKGVFHIEKGTTGWKNLDGLPDEIKAAADLAETAAEDAKEAQEAADAAGEVADAAKDRLNTWADDGVISPTEKLVLRQELKDLQAEYESTVTDCGKYGITNTSNYVSSWSAYKAELEYHSADTPENIPVRPAFAASQNTFYTARTAILAVIADQAKAYVDFSIAGITMGAVNLLRNSGFTGNYESEELSSSTELSADTELYSKQLRYWTGVATVAENNSAVSGFSAVIGSLSQSVSLIKDESYVISFKAKGTSVAVSCGDFNTTQSLTTGYQRYVFKFTFNGTGIFMLSGTATLCDIQLERGTIATDWKPSPLDNDKSMVEIQAINYIASAIKNGSVDMLGGLILANMIQLGNYKNGKMQKVTAGVSGIYNDDNDVAFWSGGTFSQAIRTVMNFREDPNFQPTDADWTNLANFVATHGGDVFLKGYIYALGGLFRGKVETSIDGNRIVIDPRSKTFKMINENEKEVLNIHFKTTDSRTFTEIISTNYFENEISDEIIISPNGVMIWNPREGVNTYLSSSHLVSFGNSSQAEANSFDIGLFQHGDGDNQKWQFRIGADVWPTADEVSLGEVYNDCGTLKVKQ
ncbi:hypothetical protein [Phocaeicola sp.]